MGGADGHDDAVLCQIGLQCINRLGALPDREIAGAIRHRGRFRAWLFTGANRFAGRDAPSAIASASVLPCFCRLTNGLM